MMASRRDNGSNGDNPFEWDQYDGLPPLVRRVMQAAAVELGTNRATLRLRRGMPVAEVAQREWDVAEAARQKLLAKYWPPGHPELPR